MVQVLLKVGADVEAKEMAGKTPLDLARNDEVKTALREHGAKHSLVYAAEEGMVELVADLINEGAEVNEKAQNGETSLHVASMSGHAAVVQHHLSLPEPPRLGLDRGFQSRRAPIWE